jgi:hypothetical protein
MRRIIIAVLAASLSGLVVVGGASPAAAATACDRVKPKPNGYVTCYEVTGMQYRVVRVDSVPARNFTKKRIKTSCKFTTTITRSFEAGVTYTGSGKATIAHLVDLGGSWTASVQVSMTAQRSTEVAGEFYLDPGETVTCFRTYGFVKATVKSYDRWDVGAQVRNVRTSTVKVPSSIGVDFV